MQDIREFSWRIKTMIRTFWKRTVSLALAAVLLAAAPVSVKAAEKRFTLIPLEATDVQLDQTAFPYTGQEIRPNVTVRVKDQLLTLDKDYTLEYADNIQVGTGRVLVTGIATASETFGYTGTVEIPFQITRDEPAYTLIELKGTDVTIDGATFPYTGEAIEPKVTVTVEGKTLTAGKDYSVAYRNNIQPGTGTVTVSGIATASETVGYTGTVDIDFTIVKEETPPETTVPETTVPETTVPETTVPETTVPETTVPETTQPESVAYKITKGNKATWFRQSSKDLSFTADGKFKDFTGVRVDGKDLAEKYFTVKSGSTVVTLKKDFLQKLSVGNHTVTILFEDGQAEGTFRVSEGLDTTNPETGDNSRIGLWCGIMAITAAAGTGLIVFRKKIFA